MWIDTHSHLDAPEFDQNKLSALEIIAQSTINNVAICVIPAVQKSNFESVQSLAHVCAQAYALGIHPQYVPQAQLHDLIELEAWLVRYRDDPRLVAIGEIGVDLFVSALRTPEMIALQTQFYRAQLKLAKKLQFPVILHVRKSADQLLRGLRDIGSYGGIAHAFNGSKQQAMQFVDMGFALGFGGNVTYERAHQIRSLARWLPDDAIVMETDSPDLPPSWLYTRSQDRAKGIAQGVNSPLELPRIGQILAELRAVSATAWAAQTTENALRVLPKLKSLLRFE